VPLPIVAPPPFEEIPRAPFNEEEAAERRIRVLMERENVERRADGLLCMEQGACKGLSRGREGEATVDNTADTERGRDSSGEGMVISMQRDGGSEDGSIKSRFAQANEIVLGIDEDIRVECVDWILEVSLCHHDPCCRSRGRIR